MKYLWTQIKATILSNVLIDWINPKHHIIISILITSVIFVQFNKFSINFYRKILYKINRKRKEKLKIKILYKNSIAYCSCKKKYYSSEIVPAFKLL